MCSTLHFNKERSLKETTEWQKKTEIIPMEQREKMEGFVRDLVAHTECESAKDWTQTQLIYRKKYKLVPRKAQLKVMYEHLVLSNEIEPNASLQRYLIRKGVRSLSGVLVVTVFTSPFPQYVDPDSGKVKTQRFSCKHNCYYCPNEPDMPRSYLSDEPGVRRGHRHNWDAIDQFYSRASTLRDLGHPIDKIEILVLGGTWSEYPVPYQQEFIRDIYWSANTFYDGLSEFSEKRVPLSLAEEQAINDSAPCQCRIIGVTLETRPDSIDVSEIVRLRSYGCTRLQIGIQHTDDAILAKINRGCCTADAVRAVRLLKNCAFKIDFHLMPDLPGSTPQRDQDMIGYLLHSDELQADQWKLYPTQTVPWTVIKKWNDEGLYTPYSQRDLVELLIWIKSRVPPWIRLNRVIRDIPEHYISAGNAVTNLRQTLLREMKQRGLKCRCIRCREIGAVFRDANEPKIKKKKQNRKQKRKQEMKVQNENVEPAQKKNVAAEIVMKERRYESSNGEEIFISFEGSDEEYIYGFVRLRLPAHENARNPKFVSEFEEIYTAFPVLQDAALVRELHVYGQMLKVGDRDKDKLQTTKKGEHDLYAQHYGFGTKLMRRAEEIARQNGYARISVIAGVGTRAYYRKLGYELNGTYMVKELHVQETYVQKHKSRLLMVASAVTLTVAVTYWMHRKRLNAKNEQ